MGHDLILSCAGKSTVFKIDLKNTNNLNGIFSNFVVGSNKPNTTIFNFSQKKCEIKDVNLYTQICESLKKLQSLAGKKDTIDDADFNTAQLGQSTNKNWCCESCVDMTISYTPDKNKSFFHITPEEND